VETLATEKGGFVFWTQLDGGRCVTSLERRDRGREDSKKVPTDSMWPSPKRIEGRASTMGFVDEGFVEEFEGEHSDFRDLL
jgi:hypothetical protein